jgi:hypothetical protein
MKLTIEITEKNGKTLGKSSAMIYSKQEEDARKTDLTLAICRGLMNLAVGIVFLVFAARIETDNQCLFDGVDISSAFSVILYGIGIVKIVLVGADLLVILYVLIPHKLLYVLAKALPSIGFIVDFAFMIGLAVVRFRPSGVYCSEIALVIRGRLMLAWFCIYFSLACLACCAAVVIICKQRKT